MTNVSAAGWCDARAFGLPPGALPGRVARVDRGRLTVLTAAGERRVRPATGLHGDAGVPAVGDWVVLRGDLAVAVLPRRTAFVRTGGGRASTAQVVAANVDTVLVVDSLAGTTRLRRVERYLALAWSSGATPVVVLTKADLCGDVPAAVELVAEGAPGVDVLAVSALTGEGLGAVAGLIGPGRTAAMVGPSGVGKSSLLNALAGRPVAATADVRGDGKGRHTTTARELHRLPGGGLLVDTPACESWPSSTTPTGWTPPSPTSPTWPEPAGSATARTVENRAAPWPPPSTTGGSTPRGCCRTAGCRPKPTARRCGPTPGSVRRSTPACAR